MKKLVIIQNKKNKKKKQGNKFFDIKLYTDDESSEHQNR